MGILRKQVKRTKHCSPAWWVVTLSMFLVGDSGWCVVASHLLASGARPQHVAYVRDQGGASEIRILTLGAGRSRRIASGLTEIVEPSWSPDGRKLVFTGRRGREGNLFVISRDGSGLKRITSGKYYDGSAQWLPDGKQISFLRQELPHHAYVVQSDGSGLRRVPESWLGAWSRDGKVIAFAKPTTADVDEHRADLYLLTVQTGRIRPLTRFRAELIDIAWSPDGKRIAFVIEVGGSGRIYTVSRTGSDLRMLAAGRFMFESLAWSPDGRQLAYVGIRCAAPSPRMTNLDNRELYVMSASGQRKVRLTDTWDEEFTPQWTRDGTHLVFQRTGGSGSNVYIMNDDGSGQTSLTPDPGWNGDAAISP